MMQNIPAGGVKPSAGTLLFRRKTKSQRVIPGTGVKGYEKDYEKINCIITYGNNGIELCNTDYSCYSRSS